LLILGAVPCLAAELKPEATQAYDRYIHDTEARLAAAKPFLWLDASPERLRTVRLGQVAVGPWKADGDTFVPGASIHDWVGAVFIPGAKLEKTLGVLQDYDHHKNIYKDVPESKLLSHDGNDFKYYRLRVLKNGPINGVFRTEFEAHYQPVDPARWVLATHTTRVTEIEGYGKPEQRELPPGRGSGYLWKLNGYWRLEQRDGGVPGMRDHFAHSRSAPHHRRAVRLLRPQHRARGLDGHSAGYQRRRPQVTWWWRPLTTDCWRPSWPAGSPESGGRCC
jgi:hypothetical protein